MSDTNRVSELLTQNERTDSLKIVCLLGRNGAGKDSRVAKAMETLGDHFTLMTMSNLISEKQKRNPEFNAYAENLMNKGYLLPDDVVSSILFTALEQAREAGKVVILNGYPRTESQAWELLQWASTGCYSVERAIVVQLDESIIVKRLSDRRVCPNRCASSPYTVSDYHPPKIPGICDDCGAPLIQRPDDQPEIIKRRIREYDESEAAILETLAGLGNVTISRVDSCDAKVSQREFNAILAEVAEI